MGNMVNWGGLAYDFLLKLLKWILVGLTAFLIVIVFFNVVGRYVFNFSLAWAEEASRFLFIWTILIGSVLTNEKYEHMNLDILVHVLPARMGAAVQVFAQLVIIVVLGLIIRGGVIATVENIAWESPALEIPYGLIYSIVPFCCSIMLIQTVMRLVRILGGRR